MDREYLTKLNKLYCRLQELYTIWAKQNNLSYNTMMLLYALNELKQCTQKDIVEGWLIPKQTLNSSMKYLENMGYVTYKNNPNDKRSKFICFTEKGQLYANEVLADLYALELKALGGIDCNAYYENLELYALNFQKGVNLE